MKGDRPQGAVPARWLTKADACAYCTMSETTFDENIKLGAFPPAIRLPTGALKWDREDIDAAMIALKNGRTAAVTPMVRDVPYITRKESRRVAP